MLNDKLHSRRGASITFALLLFLVCAAVGSVVLASATATAGRASGNYEYDQRYYAVTSAAELLRDTLEGQSLTVTIEQKSYAKQVTTTKQDAAFEVLDTDTAAKAEIGSNDALFTTYKPSCTIKLNDADVPVSSSVLLERAALDLIHSRTAAELLGNPSLTRSDGDTETSETLHLTITPENASERQKSLDVQVTETIGRDGSLTLVVENEGEGDHYCLELVLLADKNATTTTSEVLQTSIDDTVDDPDTTNNPGGHIHTRTNVYVTTTTQTTVITWRAVGIGKVA